MPATRLKLLMNWTFATFLIWKSLSSTVFVRLACGNFSIEFLVEFAQLNIDINYPTVAIVQWHVAGTDTLKLCALFNRFNSAKATMHRWCGYAQLICQLLDKKSLCKCSIFFIARAGNESNFYWSLSSRCSCLIEIKDTHTVEDVRRL